MAREKLLQVRINTLEKEAVEALAKQEGITAPELVRTFIRDEARRRGLWPTGITADRDPGTQKAGSQ